MTNLDQQVPKWSEIISTILTGTLTAGICWLIVEVGSSRERWARLEERLNTQSTLILEMRTDLAEWKDRRKDTDLKLNELERRLAVIEAQNRRR